MGSQDFTTTNVYVASLLLERGFELLGTSMNDRGRTAFHFERTDALMDTYGSARAGSEQPFVLTRFVDALNQLRNMRGPSSKHELRTQARN